jgi:hypothetical protein
MEDIISCIQKIFPQDWLSDIYYNDYDGIYSEDWLEINHPLNKEIYLSVVLSERIDIAVLKNDERDILIDLGGFDYSFELSERDKLINFLQYFYETGKIIG